MRYPTALIGLLLVLLTGCTIPNPMGSDGSDAGYFDPAFLRWETGNALLVDGARDFVARTPGEGIAFAEVWSAAVVRADSGGPVRIAILQGRDGVPVVGGYRLYDVDRATGRATRATDRWISLRDDPPAVPAIGDSDAVAIAVADVRAAIGPDAPDRWVAAAAPDLEYHRESASSVRPVWYVSIVLEGSCFAESRLVDGKTGAIVADRPEWVPPPDD